MGGGARTLSLRFWRPTLYQLELHPIGGTATGPSGWRDSNPRSPAPKAGALARLGYTPIPDAPRQRGAGRGSGVHHRVIRCQPSPARQCSPADCANPVVGATILASHLGGSGRGSNPRHTALGAAALPTELPGHRARLRSRPSCDTPACSASEPAVVETGVVPGGRSTEPRNEVLPHQVRPRPERDHVRTGSPLPMSGKLENRRPRAVEGATATAVCSSPMSGSLMRTWGMPARRMASSSSSNAPSVGTVNSTKLFEPSCHNRTASGWSRLSWNAACAAWAAWRPRGKSARAMM